MQWLKDLGGIPFIEKVNNQKAALLYDEIDRNSLFKGIVATEDRSIMNATFVLTDPTQKETFEKLCKEAGINGINGHRSVGGMRASIYNAVSEEAVDALISFMADFEKKYA